MLIQKKREEFYVQIRKNEREKIFYQKRMSVQGANVTQQYTYSPDELMQFIYQSYMEEDFKQLAVQLKNFSDSYVKLLNIFVNQNPIEDDLKLLIQFTSQINTQKSQVFIDLIRLGDVPKEYTIQPARLDCLNQVLVIIINYTYLNGYNIVSSLFQQGILSILLDDILGRIVSKEKLYVSFDKWSHVFESVCQILINLILDSENPNVLETKKIILDSSFFKVWQHIYTKNMCSVSWKTVLQLEQLFFKSPSIDQIDSYNHNTFKMIQQCVQLIDQTYLEDDIYTQVLELLFHLSQKQVATTLTLTKSLWKRIIKINKIPNLYFSLFINLSSQKCEDYLTEKHLIANGIIENMLYYLKNDNLDHMLLQKIFKLFNNILFYQCQQLVEVSLQNFIPYLNLYIKQRSPLSQQVVEEYIYLMRNLITHQKLELQHLEILIIRLDIIETIQIILLNSTQQLKMLAQLFFSFNTLPLKIKYIILQKVDQYQIIQIINKIASSISNDDEGCLETIFELLQNWESDTNYFSEM